LVNFGALLAIVGILHALLGRRAALAAALLVSTPLALAVTGSLFIENVLAATILAVVLALDRLRRYRDGGSLFAAGLLLGAALSMKLGAISCVVPLALFAAPLARRSRGRVIYALAALLVVGGLPYLYAWRVAGSPLYPFVPSIFSSSYPGHIPPA